MKYNRVHSFKRSIKFSANDFPGMTLYESAEGNLRLASRNAYTVIDVAKERDNFAECCVEVLTEASTAHVVEAVLAGKSFASRLLGGQYDFGIDFEERRISIGCREVTGFRFDTLVDWVKTNLGVVRK